MTPKTASRLAWSLAGISLAMVAATWVLVFLNREVIYTLQQTKPIELVVPVGFALMGAMVASRQPGNAVGWLFLGIAVVGPISGFGPQYALRDLTTPGSLWGTTILAWAAQWSVSLIFPAGLAAFLFMLFPSGDLPSRRWRWLAWLAVTFTVVATAGSMLAPYPIVIRPRLPRITNPVSLAFFGDLWEGPVGEVLWLGGLAILVLSVVALLVRLRGSTGVEREQIKLFAYSAAAGVVTVLVPTILLLLEVRVPEIVQSLCIVLGFGIALPVAAGVAVLRYRLFDVELVLRKTVVYALLAAFITGVYLLVVVFISGAVFGIGTRGSVVPTLLAVIAVALVLQPIRNRAQRLANRLVFGKRATPYEVLSEFGERLAGSYATEDVLPRVARVAGEGVGASRSTVWLRVGGELRPAATWPVTEDRPEPLALHEDSVPLFAVEEQVFEVRHQGALFGALTVAMPPRDPLTPTGEKLLQGLAAQAGLILRNVRLIEELRASRQRIVAAQDEERRRLERNIHDGAQQELVALSVKVRLAETLVQRDPDRAESILREVKAEATEALESLRDLARGIYPPLLADKGLAVALEAQARKAAVPVVVDPDGVGRYPQEVEAGVYFCVLEALQNVSKYADASAVNVRLAQDDGSLVFAVVDDGHGFDPASTPPGMGLQNMRDRIEALGGQLEITSAPGRGTMVTGRVPLQAAPDAAVQASASRSGSNSDFGM